VAVSIVNRVDILNYIDSDQQWQWRLYKPGDAGVGTRAGIPYPSAKPDESIRQRQQRRRYGRHSRIGMNKVLAGDINAKDVSVS